MNFSFQLFSPPAFDQAIFLSGLSPLMTGEEMTRTDDLLSLSLYLTEVYHTFRCEIPHINHPKLVSVPKFPSHIKQDDKMKPTQSDFQLPHPVSLNELLLKKSMLKPVVRNEQQVEDVKTPFDYWLKQNEDKEELKFFDENFREVSAGLLAATSSSVMTVQEAPERDLNVTISKSSLEESSVTPEGKSSCDIKIRLIKQDSYNKQLTQTLSYNLKQNALYVSPKQKSHIKDHYVPKCLREGKYQAGYPLATGNTCHTSNNLPFLNVHQFKFLFKANMSDHHLSVPPEQIYERVVEWLNSSGDTAQKAEIILENEFETNIPGNLSDISSITKVINKERWRRSDLEKLVEGDEVPRKVSENTVLTQDSSDARLQSFVEKLRNNAMVKGLKKITNLSALQLYKMRMNANSKTPSIPAILEKDEVVCFSLYTFPFLMFLTLLLTSYNEFFIFILFCPY